MNNEALWAAWAPLAEKALRGAPLDSLDATTPDGFVLRPLYGAAEPSRLGRPGHGPWQRVARVDGGTAEPLDDLGNGATALSLVFAGAPSAYGRGLTAATVDDLDAALAGVMLDLVPVTVEAGLRAIPALALVVALCHRRGTMPAALHGGLDLMGAFAVAGTMPDVATARAASASAARALAAIPGTVLCADGRPVAEAGGAPATELAFALHSLAGKLRGHAAEGISAAETLPKVAMALGATEDQFATIAKLRAARRLHRLIADACGVSAPLHLTATTTQRMLSVADPETNLIRLTIAAFSAGVGGADAVAVLPFDAAASPFGRRLARNIQSLLVEESHVARLDDPAAGAGAVEAYTDALAEAAWTLFQSFEADPDLIASGRLADRVTADAAAAEQAARSGARPIVGVTIHPPKTRGATAPDPVAPPTALRLPPLTAAFDDLVTAARDGATLADLAAQLGTDPLTCPPLTPQRAEAPFGG